MAIQEYRAQYFYVDPSSGIGSWVAFGKFVSFTANIGRRAQLDQYNAETATLVFRWPQPDLALLSDLKPGISVRVKNNTTGYIVIAGTISDTHLDYGIPYISSTTTANADYFTLSVECGFASFARMAGNNYGMSSGTLTSQCATASAQTGRSVGGPSDGSSITMAATTVSGTWGDWINRVCLTLNDRLGQGSGGVRIISKYTLPTSSANFSDTANNATNQVYEQLQFTSLADNYYTQVTVAPESYSSATVQAGSVPYRTYAVNTLNASTGQATDYANYLLGNYKTPAPRLSQIVCKAESQSVFKLDDLNNDGGFGFSTQALVGYKVSVAFRGTTYNAIIEGITVSADPSGSTYTYYLSGADLNAYLILDNAVFGKLDSNKLGY